MFVLLCGEVYEQARGHCATHHGGRRQNDAIVASPGMSYIATGQHLHEENGNGSIFGAQGGPVGGIGFARARQVPRAGNSDGPTASRTLTHHDDGTPKACRGTATDTTGR